MKTVIFIMMALIACLMAGCVDSPTKHQNNYLIQVGSQTKTVFDFNKALEIAKTAYSYDSVKDKALLKNLKIRLLNQMIEKMLLLERAKELNINISDLELNVAIENIKKDYPDNAFKQIMLEYAVSYNSWKIGLKNRMLMEKVTAQELESNIVVTPEEVSKFHQEQRNKNATKEKNDKKNDDSTEKAMEYLRKKKAEEIYQSWIKDLREKYAIKINQAPWEKIISS